MKKVLIILFSIVSLTASAQWISDGESGLSVRTKLNNFYTLIHDSVQYGKEKIDSLQFDAESSVTLNDTMNYVWVSLPGDNDTVRLPDASDWKGKIYTIMKPDADDTLIIYCDESDNLIYFIKSESAARSYLFNDQHTGIIQVISNGDKYWFAIKLDDIDLTP